MLAGDCHPVPVRPILRVLRWFIGLLAGGAILLLLVVAALVWWTLPPGDAVIKVPGLHAPVAIDIDHDGIPRIRAADEEDAAAALGLMHARDRMFQMDLMRRNASGRLSELAGPITLPQDRFMRTLGLRAAAEADLAALPPDVRHLLDAYARGVNAWIARRGRFAAPEFLPFGAPAPWSATDSLLWGKTMALYLAANWRSELARLALSRTMSKTAIDALWPSVVGDHADAAALTTPALAATASHLAQAIPAFPDAFTEPETASNEWAVDGRRSASGAPLLAGDPHLALSLPGIWYLVRIDLPGGTTRVGATSPGVPILVLGHNGHIAWSFTTTGADTQDLFIETPLPGGQYAAPNGPLPFGVREERIRVRGGVDQMLRVRTTRHGPVISDLIDPRGPVLALSAVELQPGDTAASGLWALNRAGSVAEAFAAATAITNPVQNLVVADRDGIGLALTGRVPVRRSGDGRWPQSGADGAHDWIGFASGDQLPRFLHPASGQLVNANEPIAPALQGAFLGADSFKDFRARRIRALLGASERFGVADFSAMQADTLDLLARDLLPRLRDVAPSSELDQKAVALLRTWDGRAVTDAPQPLIFNAWIRGFADTVLQRLGVPPELRSAAAPWPDFAADALSPDGAQLCGGSCDALLAESLRTSMAALARDYGADPAAWRWGRAHPAVFAHPMLRAIPILGRLVEGRIAAPGDETTIDLGGGPGRQFRGRARPKFSRRLRSIGPGPQSVRYGARAVRQPPESSGPQFFGPLARRRDHRDRSGRRGRRTPYCAGTTGSSPMTASFTRQQVVAPAGDALIHGVLSRRVFAFVLDGLMIACLCGVLWLLLLVFGLLTLGLGLPLLGLVPFVPLLYNWLSVASSLSATPGQRIMGLVVRRDADLGAPTPLEALIWTAGFVVTISLGGVWFGFALLTVRHRTLHDIVSGLVVVRRKALTARPAFWDVSRGGPHYA